MAEVKESIQVQTGKSKVSANSSMPAASSKSSSTPAPAITKSFSMSSETTSKTGQLSVKSLGLAIGITCAIFIFLTGLAAWLLNWGNSWVELLNDIYIGFNPTFLGSIIGAAYSFVDGFIFGALIAFFYNKF